MEVCAECGMEEDPGIAFSICLRCGFTFHIAPLCLAPCAACEITFCSPCRVPEEHSCLVDVIGSEQPNELIEDSDPPTDEEEAEEQEVAAHTAVDVAATEGWAHEVPEFPPEGAVRHMRHRTIHRHSADPASHITACGFTLLPADWEELQGWPGVPWPLCGRSRCFK